MIEKIGIKRATILGVLAGLLGVLFFMSSYVLGPKTIESKRQLDAVSAESYTLQTEVDKMRNDFAQFEGQKQLYETIRRMGFFNDQDRVLARERFETMQRLSKIIAARYEIKAANILTEESPVETGFVLMESPITVELTAVDDLDIYRFIYYLNYGFPGHITINSLVMERKADLSSDVLKQMGAGEPPALITAKMEMDWRTMARKEAIAATAPVDPNAVPAGGTP